ncbi:MULTISPECIES: flagellar filament capping protein FliD [Chromobacterium]|uniref:Flagellar hook-associated protein 2 n=4 Tax=Chromobacterium TaxID=535 RepID=A0ABS3GNX6_9NEIS|nr:MULTISPECIES: flagellar filament capping protein FliD [Chromobacterium]AXT49201.1 flagellar protein [Chromobacterium rhizoryzae]MBK0415045.1 flagellar filament capping protein FliD [Chromobacterium haemolyticum]MBO0416285.1 flagellar filament capping protein FliD [Chromobacterium haemolyticum]MBO0499683.1 flagellar filament capping protein FliD [Chromobacterium haemolyticum]MDH0342379.1 flagellar filament capping protein FliD [Chromobacterium haemolyticum]
MAGITTSVGSLDVQTIVSQLMAIDSRPLVASQKKLDGYNTQLSDLGKIGSALSALQSAITSLSTGSFLQAFKVSSSDTSVAGVSTTSGGVNGTYVVNVAKLATSRQLVFDQFNGVDIKDAQAEITGAPDELKFTINGKEQTVKLRDKPGDKVTLQSISDKINAEGMGVNASVVKNGDNYKLVVASTASGTDNKFTISAGGTDSGSTSGSTLAGLTQSPTAANESKDAGNADLTVNGVQVSSGSNKVSNAIPGVELDLYKGGAGVSTTVTLNQDTAGIGKNLQSFVDAYNQVLSSIKDARGGSMKGNASVLSIQQKLQDVLTKSIPGVDPVNSYAYLSQVGIAIQKDGTLKLDQTKFNDALKKDPTAVKNLFGNTSTTGIAQLLNKEINSLLGPTGVVESSKTSINTRISTEKASQDALTARLAARQKQYIQQYTALNSTLSKMTAATNNLSGLMSQV